MAVSPSLRFVDTTSKTSWTSSETILVSDTSVLASIGLRTVRVSAGLPQVSDQVRVTERSPSTVPDTVSRNDTFPSDPAGTVNGPTTIVSTSPAAPAPVTVTVIGSPIRFSGSHASAENPSSNGNFWVGSANSWAVTSAVSPSASPVTSTRSHTWAPSSEMTSEPGSSSPSGSVSSAWVAPSIGGYTTVVSSG